MRNAQYLTMLYKVECAPSTRFESILVIPAATVFQPGEAQPFEWFEWWWVASGLHWSVPN